MDAARYVAHRVCCSGVANISFVDDLKVKVGKGGFEDEAVCLQTLPILQGGVRGQVGGDHVEHLLQHHIPLESFQPDLLTFLLHSSEPTVKVKVKRKLDPCRQEKILTVCSGQLDWTVISFAGMSVKVQGGIWGGQ